MAWNLQKQDFSFWANFTKDFLNLQILLYLLNFLKCLKAKPNFPCKECF